MMFSHFCQLLFSQPGYGSVHLPDSLSVQTAVNSCYNECMRITYLIPLALGILISYLVNYLADVLPKQRKFIRPICIKCDKPFSWREYLFFISCSGCQQKRNFRSYIILSTGIIFSILLWLFPPARLGYWLGLLVFVYFCLVVVIDIENRLILHVVNLVGAIIGLMAGTIRFNLTTALLGGVAGFLIMLFFYWFGVLFSRFRARKLGYDDGEEALGFGDVFLSVVLGLMLGWPLIIYGLLLGILLGGLFSLVLILFLLATHRYQTMTVLTAYGPYLVVGAMLLIYFPQTLTLLLGN
jgi:leader peptidase (prepilin peptidase)/N-methyltransferase